MDSITELLERKFILAMDTSKEDSVSYKVIETSYVTNTGYSILSPNDIDNLPY